MLVVILSYNPLSCVGSGGRLNLPTPSLRAKGYNLTTKQEASDVWAYSFNIISYPTDQASNSL